MRVAAICRIAIRSVCAIGALTAVGVLASCSGGDTAAPIVTISRVDVTAPTQAITAQQTVQLTAVARASDNSTLSTASIVWNSSATNIATVSASGLVAGVAAGTTTIRATSGTVSGTVVITVTSGAGVLSAATVTVADSPVEIGQGTQATIQGRDALGAVVAIGNRTVTYTSSNTTVATISNSGGVQGIGVGSTTIGISIADGTNTISATTALTVTAVANAPQSADVSMLPQQFVPFQTTVKVGGNVRFFFTSIDHNVIWNPRLAGSPTDILVTVNTTVSRTFPTMGVYKYECTVHPGMVGVIVVSP